MIWETVARDSSVSVSGVTADFCEPGSDYLGCVRAANVRLQSNLSQFPTAYQHIRALD
jgi:hypothetical protein